MSTPKQITIIGGGLAGLTLGIGLRQRDVPVRLIEAGHYPRHRVCGEFISGHGLESLEQLGLLKLIDRHGAVPARTAAFYNGRAGSGVHALPAEARCISRSVLDAGLAEEFQRLGGELRVGERWRTEECSEGVVRASGRRVQPTDTNGARWFGLKMHARGVELETDLEMHLTPRGYVGLCRLPGGEVNVCGLFRRAKDEAGGANDRREALRGEAGSKLRDRLERAEWIESSFCSVAGLSLCPCRAAARAECCVGDAITMIPPVTGNGMSMAFESAELALAPLQAYARGELSWTDAQLSVATQCDELFARRLRWAGWLQALMLAPWSQRALVPALARSDWLWRLWFARTR